ncbi:hypothetical protein DAPPUDRAFT_308785 [Daphnia pulex]|uniref:Glycosyltransferase family 92 protein n=1 Tax=Daphnia pulex TaxID=6669 RepID=E9H984_DAPPU|nr:hypothetical protein DAPPUDRAFT_308785 [Daphnia pulex]|eukprot:EFX71575.1 hypothetical protein DAPPUDRAFT_308785 [Daphnia pulex]
MESSFIQGLAHNVPYEYWMHEKAKNSSSKNKPKPKCAFFPSVFDLRFNNNYWQTLRSSNGTFYLYGAYYDSRKIIQQPVVRILGMIDRLEPTVKSNCLFWYDIAKDPLVMPVVEYKYVWNKKWGNYKQGLLQPYLMTCNLPNPADLVDKGFKLGQIPVSVSLTEKGCEPPTNNLLINNKVPAEKKRFAVCVKGLDFLQVDLSVRLVEWIELLGLLGADKIFLYELEVHPNASKVLQHYQETGQVELTPISLPGDQPNLPGLRHLYLKSKIINKRQNELIPYNDCLYRNLNSYDYIALLDTDEVIMPREVSTWNELMEKVLAEVPSNKSPSSYNFRNVYFWDDAEHSHTWHHDIPRHMHMMQHVYRSYNYTKPRAFVKCFHDVQRVMTLHNHFPFACLGGGCTSHGVEPETAHLQHYRGDCQTKKNCDVDFKQFLVKDTTIWRYKEDLIYRVDAVLKKLGFLNEDDDGYR